MQSERVFSSSLRYRFVAYCLLLYSTSQCISTGIARASRLRLCCNWTRPCGPASVRLRFSQCRTRPLRGRPRRASLGALHRRRLPVKSHTESVGARSASSRRGLLASLRSRGRGRASDELVVWALLQLLQQLTPQRHCRSRRKAVLPRLSKVMEVGAVVGMWAMVDAVEGVEGRGHCGWKADTRRVRASIQR